MILLRRRFLGRARRRRYRKPRKMPPRLDDMMPAAAAAMPTRFFRRILPPQQRAAPRGADGYAAVRKLGPLVTASRADCRASSFSPYTPFVGRHHAETPRARYAAMPARRRRIRQRDDMPPCRQRAAAPMHHELSRAQRLRFHYTPLLAPPSPPMT